jgi:hypothetical protein
VLRYWGSSVSAPGTSIRLGFLLVASALLRLNFLVRGLDGSAGVPSGDVCALTRRAADVQ